MARANALRALPKTWFRFTDEEDQGKYGDRWYCYDESALMRSRGRELVELENELGMPLVAAMNGFRASTTLGDLAVTWIGIRSVDSARAGEFDEYNPLVHMIEWTPVNPDPEAGPKDLNPELTPGPPESNSPTRTDSSNMTSETTDTVVLQTLPVAE